MPDGGPVGVASVGAGEVAGRGMHPLPTSSPGWRTPSSMITNLSRYGTPVAGHATDLFRRSTLRAPARPRTEPTRSSPGRPDRRVVSAPYESKHLNPASIALLRARCYPVRQER